MQKQEAKPPKPKAGYTFVYGLTDPVSGAVRYVGQSKNPAVRLYTHIREAQAWEAAWGKSRKPLIKPSQKVAWIVSLIKAGRKPGITILCCVLSQNATAYENRMIAALVGAGHLTNRIPKTGLYITAAVTAEKGARVERKTDSRAGGGKIGDHARSRKNGNTARTAKG